MPDLSKLTDEELQDWRNDLDADLSRFSADLVRDDDSTLHPALIKAAELIEQIETEIEARIARANGHL